LERVSLRQSTIIISMSHDSSALEAKVRLEVLEGNLAEEQLGGVRLFQAYNGTYDIQMLIHKKGCNKYLT
jgi:hypothetical protein